MWWKSVRSLMAMMVMLVFVFIAVWVLLQGVFEKHSEAIFVVIMWVVREYFGKHQQEKGGGTA